MDLSPVSDPRPDGWPGNQQSEHEGDEATVRSAASMKFTQLIIALFCIKCHKSHVVLLTVLAAYYGHPA